MKWLNREEQERIVILAMGSTGINLSVKDTHEFISRLETLGCDLIELENQDLEDLDRMYCR